jgi:hypothetical protein
VFIGNWAGYNETGSNKLYISNGPTNKPLIYGDFDNKLARINGSTELNGLVKLTSTTPEANVLSLVHPGTTCIAFVDPNIPSDGPWTLGSLNFGPYYEYAYDVFKISSPSGHGLMFWDNGNADLDGTLTEWSDIRLKRNVASLNGCIR